MSKPKPKTPLRAQIRDLTRRLAAEQKARSADAERHLEEVKQITTRVQSEQDSRVAAQNGLTPYVYAIQALNEWLVQERPDLGRELQPLLERLGIWGVKVGYDPKRDFSLTVLGKLNRARQREAALKKSPLSVNSVQPNDH